MIRAHEEHFLRRAVASWKSEPALEILGNLDAERLSIVSFVVRCPGSGKYLHHNFVVALLNDLFGIQSRGGCSCAGPYGHRLLGIDIDRTHEFEREITGGCEGIKPGWVRINFNYFLSEPVFDYLVEAVRLVARDGWRLLGDYRFEPATGLWRHRDGAVEPPLRLRQLATTPTGGCATRGIASARRNRSWPATSTTARRSWPPAARWSRIRTSWPAWSRPTSSSCAGSSCPSAAWPAPAPTDHRPTGDSRNGTMQG